MSHIKRFLEWINLKEKLHKGNQKQPMVNERDVWWISFGENVGSEINGKSHLFSRPGLILKKLSRGFYLVAQTTTQTRERSWYSKINLEGRETFACLHQIRVIDYRRMSSRLGQINSDNFVQVKKTFLMLYK